MKFLLILGTLFYTQSALSLDLLQIPSCNPTRAVQVAPEAIGRYSTRSSEAGEIFRVTALGIVATSRPLYDGDQLLTEKYFNQNRFCRGHSVLHEASGSVIYSTELYSHKSTFLDSYRRKISFRLRLHPDGRSEIQETGYGYGVWLKVIPYGSSRNFFHQWHEAERGF
jgi:hypothetical protein